MALRSTTYRNAEEEMAHQVCHDVGQWISNNVSQQVENCIEQDCDWWCACCNKWFCFLVWVVVTVVSWVVTTVCEIIADVVDTVINIVKGLWDVLAGIFTLDWSRIVAGLGEIVGAVILLVLNLIPIVTLGTLVGAFVEEINKWRLRDFARDLLEKKYKKADPAGFDRMVDALGLKSGGFGLRLNATALRSFIRSDFSTQRDGTPDLIGWIAANGLNLKALAGFNPPAWWSRDWPELVGDSGDISSGDLDTYVAMGGRGDGVKKFSLFAMSTGDLQSRLDCADTHSSELALMFRWTVRDAMLTRGDQVLINRSVFPSVLPNPPFSRTSAAANPAGATSELGKPMTIGCFDFSDGMGMGISAHLASSVCLEADDSGSTAFNGEGITGTAVRYRKPDVVFKYTVIHELGHTFGLCHVDGALRIMFTNAPGEDKSVWSWSSLFQYWTNGVEAGFIFDEGKKVWQYIVDNFDSATLQTRAF
jgi:hypothetical protein